MRFRIMGPVEVWDGEIWITPTAAKQRALLGVLLCNANRTVPNHQLVDELWGERPPVTAAKLLHTYIARLRGLLADPRGEILVTRPHGYQIRVLPEQLDAEHFIALVTNAQRLHSESKFSETVSEIDTALALWHDEPLADTPSCPSVVSMRARLSAHWLTAVETRAEAALALGHHSALVTELEALVKEHPRRERLRAHLMLALYRSGRQADALATYHELRQHLADELGIDPAPEVQRLHQDILTADPALRAPVPH